MRVLYPESFALSTTKFITFSRFSFFFFLLVSLSLTAQDPFDFSSEKLMPSPKAASLGKYIDSPVDQSTGIPDITIPLYEVKDGNLRLPISLKYHLGGLKVQEVASDIGEGWSLHSGGMVSRALKGLPDEVGGGYMDNFDFVNNGQYDPVPYGLNGGVDTEPDIFTFSAGGYSGKFFYSDEGWTTATIQNIRIESTIVNPSSSSGMIVSFEITIPDGTKYIYGKFQDLDGLEISMSAEFTSGLLHNSSSAWHLVRIVSADGHNQIDFKYTDYKYGIISKNYNYYSKERVVFDQNNRFFKPGCSSNLNLDGSEYSSSKPEYTQFYYGKNLFQITSSTDLIEFVREETPREDIKDFVELELDIDDMFTTSPSYAIDYIKINNGSFCQKYVLNHGYFADIEKTNFKYYDKRLKLLSVSQEFCSGGNNEKLMHKFYYGHNDSSPDSNFNTRFAPNRKSNRIDHWGFYNDEKVNDPLRLLAPLTKIGDIEYGSAKRETNKEAVKAASLRKIAYPTGGYTTYEVESNEVWDSENNKARSVGGLRVKRIKHVDPLHQKTMIKEYNYNKPGSSKSSGKLYIEPKYGWKFNFEKVHPAGANIIVEQIRIEANPIVPLGGFSGIHVRYENVEELFIKESEEEEGLSEIEGKINYTNHISMPEAVELLSQDTFFPKVPFIDDPLHGKLKTKCVKNKLGDTIEYFSNDESETENGQQEGVIGMKFKLRHVSCGANLTFVGRQSTYILRPGINRVTKTTTIKDGVTSIADYEYVNSAFTLGPLSPTAVTTTNSDGKVHRKETQYAHHLSFGEMCMRNNFMIEVPIGERNYVDGVFQGGWKVHYNVSNNGHCKPFTYYEILKGNIEHWRTKVLEYDNKGNPRRVQKRGFAEETLTWNANYFLEQRDWNNWTWEWDYYNGSRLLETYTDIDDQETVYYYDDLMRLDRITERDENIQTNFTYLYQIDGKALNSVNTKLSYTGADDISTTKYMDGLSRLVQTVKCGYSPSGHDLRETIEYDELGRPQRKYQPFPIGNSCSYISFPGTDYWETTYEESPLRRPIFNKLSSWPAGVGTFYGCNTSGDEVKVYEPGCGTSSSGVYDACSLYKVTSVDENGNPTEIYTDKIGRQVLVRKFIGRNYSPPLSNPVDERTNVNLPPPTGVKKVDTYNVYDDIGNLVLVISPEGADGNAGDVNYCYEYDDLNRVIMKDLPGSGPMTMGYYDSDLLKWETDAKGNTINYLYDEYGRLTKKYLGGSFQGDNLAGGSLIMEDEYFQENTDSQFKSQLKSSSTATITGNNIIGPLLTTQFTNYDEFARLKKSLSNNNVGGMDGFMYTYADHADNMQSINRTHSNGGGSDGITTTETFAYDHSFRMMNHNFESSLAGANNIASYTYTNKDEVDTKTVGGALLDYAYNTRSWLTDINTLGSSLPFEDYDCVPDVPFEIDLGIVPFTPCNEEVAAQYNYLEFYEGDSSCSIVHYLLVNCDSLPLCPSDGYQDVIDEFIDYISTIDAFDMGYPQNLMRVRLCDGQEIYITDSEILKAQINGIDIPDFIVLQEICINEITQPISYTNSNGVTIVVPFYELAELLNEGLIPRIEEYPECGDGNTCPYVETIPLTSVEVLAEGANCELDLSEFKLDEGGVCGWEILDEESLCHSIGSWYCFNFEEFNNTCDSMVIDSVLLDIGFYSSSSHEYCKQFEFIWIDGTQYTVDEIETFSQPISQICVILTVPECQYCLSHINQVIHYSCECPITNDDDPSCTCVPETPVNDPPCVDVLPDCTDEEIAEQEEYIEELIDWAANITLSEVDFPIEMCRTTLCDGRQISIPMQYLEEHPLPGPHDCERITSGQEPPPESCPTGNSIFAMKFAYDKPNTSYSGAKSQYNGNISQIEQQLAEKHVEGLNYQYDQLDRVTEQDYWWKSCKDQYWNNKFYNVEDITYDLNGNMKTIRRYSKPSLQICDPEQSVIDNLQMNYSGNQLISVSDGSTLEPEMGYILGDYGGGYGYDASGNMTTIGNKPFTLGYNFLNLPSTMAYGDSGGNGEPAGVSTPSWTYTADGTKLKYQDREYADGIEYKDGELYAIHHAEGRIYPKPQTEQQEANNAPLEWQNEFYIRDHLGNTRIVLDEGGIPIQENNYYPFGMNMENIDAIVDDNEDTRYLYNGKEMNEDLGWLDYGARFYDPSICRFTTVDPLAELMPSHSSYSYTFNNPLIFTDPTGMAPETIYKNKDNPEETVEVEDGVDKTIEVNDTDFQKAKDFASNINGQLEENGVVEYMDVVDYENFYNEHNSYDLSEGSFLENASSLYDYAFGGPDIPSNLSAGTVPDVGKGGAKLTISSIKRALKEIHKKVGKLPKGAKGKHGQPQRGNDTKGYRLDKEGHPKTTNPNEKGPHINWWDYTKGKRKSGNGKSGAVPINQ